MKRLRTKQFWFARMHGVAGLVLGMDTQAWIVVVR